VGFVVARRSKGGKGLFLAGRSLGWFAIGCSLFASNISSTTLVGLAGDAYESGIAVANYELWASLVLVFMAFVMVPFYLRTKITTVPEFLERRYDGWSRKYLSAFTILLGVLLETAGGLYAGTLVLQTFFPALPTAPTCVALALIAGLYTAAGGLAAVVWTDVIQTVVLLVGCVLLAGTVALEVDFAAVAALPEGTFSLMPPADDPNLPWTGVVFGLPILGFYFWANNQIIAQRILGARSERDARRGTLLAALLKLLPLFLMVMPGVFAAVLLPGLENKDQVFPSLVATYLPPGVAGVVLAGLVAAIMSSVDSSLNSASTLVTCDFYLPKHPDLSEKQIARIGRVCTFTFMAIAAVWAPYIQEMGGLFDYLQSALAYIVPPFVALFLIGIFWPRGNVAGARAALLLGHGFAVALFVTGPYVAELHAIHFTLIAPIVLAFSLLVHMGVSLMSQAPARLKTEGLTWASRGEAPAAPAVPWYASAAFHATVVLLLTMVIYAVFW